jgi:outer membrane protein assembly factor BamB
MVWKSDEYENCIVDPQKSAVIDYRKDGNDNSYISLLYATVTPEVVRIVDCHQGKIITDFSLTRQSPLQTGFIMDREGSLYYVSSWPFSNPQYTTYGVCKLPAYPLMNDSTPLWCVETDSINSSGDQHWNGVLRFDEAHNTVVLSSIVYTAKYQHKVRSIDASTGKVKWTTLLPEVDNQDGSQHESLAIDEKGNYYFTHDCCFLSIIHWDTGKITNTLRAGEDPVNLLAIGAGRLYISELNGLRMWQSTPESNPIQPWYESIYALLGFAIAGSLMLVGIIGGMTCYYSRYRHLDYRPVNDEYIG